MRILMLTPAFPPFPGGGERYIRSLARHLAQRGHAVTVLTSAAQVERELWQGCGDGVTHEQVDGLELIRCPIRRLPGGWPMLLAWRKLMVLMSLLPGDETAVLQHLARAIPPIQQMPQTLAKLGNRFDLIHGFNISWEYPLLLGWQWAKQWQIPFAVTPFAHLGAGQRDRVALNSTMDHQRRVLQAAAVVFTLTTIEQQGLQARGIEMRQVTAVGSGLDPLPDNWQTADPLTKHQLQPPFALFLGRANHSKGAVHTLQAIAQLHLEGVPVTLVLAGQTTAEFEQALAQLPANVRGWIRPLGIVSETEKHALLEAAAMLVMPSHADSFGIVFLEAWAHGKPVIGAWAGGIPGVVDDGQNGLLVPFGDVPALAQAMRHLLTQPDVAQTLGANGRIKTHTHYTWPHVTDQVEAYYEQIQ
ncbi:MAG: glycosyltransferase family 4 protein [Ardenticatenaceae bacterium]|nr:glycosyltransferase family 4 protein [Ardenticatenaceae bacterium]